MIISGYQHQTRRPSKDSALHPRVLKIHKRLDRVSPAIQEACNRARPIPLAILEVRAGDSIILLRAELQNAVIEEVQQIAEQKKVEECLKLTYDRILWIYHVYREDGSLEGVTCSTCCAPSPTPRGFIQSRP